MSSLNIKIDNVSKSFRREEVLSDINMDIRGGEITCLLGPSGSGKTTLIRLILGAISGNKGEIKISEVVVPDKKLIEKIGYMPQNNALYDDLSSEGNLKFFGGLYGMKKKDIKIKTKEILEKVGLDKYNKKLVGKFSGGMKKRLSLACALLNSPEILLLDEPTVGIDPILRRTIWKYFKELRDEGKILIITTHVMDEVSECDRAGLIVEGKLIAFDTITNLLKETKSGKIEDIFFEREEGDKIDAQSNY